MEDIPLTHPLLIVLFSSIALAFVVIEKKKKPKKEGKEEEYLDLAKSSENQPNRELKETK
jgi:hypothetical protein